MSEYSGIVASLARGALTARGGPPSRSKEAQASPISDGGYLSQTGKRFAGTAAGAGAGALAAGTVGAATGAGVGAFSAASLLRARHPALRALGIIGGGAAGMAGGGAAGALEGGISGAHIGRMKARGEPVKQGMPGLSRILKANAFANFVTPGSVAPLVYEHTGSAGKALAATQVNELSALAYGAVPAIRRRIRIPGPLGWLAALAAGYAVKGTAGTAIGSGATAGLIAAGQRKSARAAYAAGEREF